MIKRPPALLLGGSLLLASVLLSAGIWSWVSLYDAPKLGTWTDTGTVIQLIGDPPDYIYMTARSVDNSAIEYSFDSSEFVSPPQVEEGDTVTVWVASAPETLYSPYWGTVETSDRRIVRLQSQRGTWTAKDYADRVAAARAAAQPGFGLNFQTVRWVGSIGGVLLALLVLVGVRGRLAFAPSAKGSTTQPERLAPTAVRFSRSDRGVLGCSLALALVVLAASVLLSLLSRI